MSILVPSIHDSHLIEPGSEIGQPGLEAALGASGNLAALEAVSYGPLGDPEPEQAVRRLWRRLLPDTSSDPAEVGRLKVPEEGEEDHAAVWILLKPVVETVLGRLGVTLEDLICTRVQIVQKGKDDGELGTKVPPPEDGPGGPVRKRAGQPVAEQREKQAQQEQPKRQEEQRVYQREVDGPSPPECRTHRDQG